jgi:UDP-N-acetylglucosamine 2-epimerase (non-hydrolysing)
MKTILTITGIRPDFIRMCKVFEKLDQNFNHVMIHTGQHYDKMLSDTFFKELGIRSPDYQLMTGNNSKNHYEQLSYLSVNVIECIKQNKINPDLILFLGDSNSVGVALPLKKEGYTIGHIESGMRSYDRNMLEEINRTVCDVCSDVFFVYHEDYKQNLRKENIDRPVYIVGNTCVEPLRIISEKMNLFGEAKKMDKILMDIHRPENFRHPKRLQRIFDFANMLMDDLGVPVECLFFGRLEREIKENNIDMGRVKIIPLLSFGDYLKKVYDCVCLFSDSGTAQEEPCLLKTPVICPRDSTERPQSLKGNCSVQLFANMKLLNQLVSICKYVEDYNSGKLNIDYSWLGDGNTSNLIIDGIEDFLENNF